MAVASGCGAGRGGHGDGRRRARSSRSVGMPTYTGPRGARRAMRRRRRRSVDASPSASADVDRRAFVTGANSAAWSVHSCRTPRYMPGRRSVVAMSDAITTTGECDAHASPTAPSVFAAPGPVVVSATPSCAGRAGVAVGRVGAALLVARADDPDAGLRARGPEREVVHARQPEHGVDAPSRSTQRRSATGPVLAARVARMPSAASQRSDRLRPRGSRGCRSAPSAALAGEVDVHDFVSLNCSRPRRPASR